MASNDSSSFDDDTMEMLSANLPSSAFRTGSPDPRLARAWQDAERTNQITPVLKEELRYRILARRLQQGEPEIETSPKEPRKYELTEEEKQKRERRKAQNRRAAKKCREKRKMKNLSDAEKHTIMKERQQKLKNDITLLRHKEEVLKKFCIEHIVHGNCQYSDNDTSGKSELEQLLGPEIFSMDLPHSSHHNNYMACEPCHDHSPAASSTPRTSVTQDQNPSVCMVNVSEATNLKAAPDDVFETEKHAATAQLPTLPVEEISTLLPANAELNLSDHSLESTPPMLSPTTLFSTMSPIAGTVSSSTANSSYFKNALTPSSSSSGTASTSTEFLNDSDFNTDYSSKQALPSPQFFHQVSNTSTPKPSEMVYGDGFFLDQISDSLSSVPQVVKGQDTMLNSLAEEESDKPTDSNMIADDDSNGISDGVANNVIVNTALFPELPLDFLLNNYLNSQEAGEHTSNSFSHCEGETADQTIPISPLTPLSPHSPNVALPSLSPSPQAVETQTLYVDTSTHSSCSTPKTGRFQGSSGVMSSASGNTAIPMAPARPAMRRTSSTASVPSPYFNQQSSSSLSPPPSVPSPPSHGVPESPSILSGVNACDDNNTYHPQFSPISSVVSGELSPVRVRDVSGEDLNHSLRH